ncbi:MAG: bifunctional hexulose-6-phosphate synthase/ribonuclease regulator [Candidatus Solincola sediminis]|uniref:3-hexulose-6-phosphate synthase n=1 Tax=Candidatus Solincola sediminis TaxID=1797199 RepID=A0A1F2WF43_9ACTN|nr:MAG: bifunctional hexulose-6-phosphate synthase/ribonuclease regulator [Candidatus Solincola sediminis]OFW57847.1 MAG: bifunctional hexulose-6-phosphate synthase/ribonuclease regulator [Candidatus Solincola sediminis]
MKLKEPVLQIALDFVDIERAIKVAEEAVAGGADWIEAGTPLIKSEGLNAVRALRQRFPDRVIIADMKTMDAGRAEVESAAKAGASIIDVLGAASDATIKECVEAADNYGAEIIVDLIQVGDPVERARAVEALGVDYIAIHTAIDVQMRGGDPFERLKVVANAVSIPVAVAGGINSETAAKAVAGGANIIIVGGAVIKSKDAKAATAEIKRAMRSGETIRTELYKRADLENVRDALILVSTANISDAMHRTGELEGIVPILPGIKMAGPALTVRTYPGDWAKPVEAIDLLQEGDVLAIDAGGIGPAVWGELATHSAMQKRAAGLVLDGAIRDTPEIRSLNFPAFSRLRMPTAGEPKGFGEINVAVKIGGRRVFPGDWLVGDDDGVILIPRDKVVEVANRAMDVLEKENRLRGEIEAGSTLSQVAYLEKWEKRH